MPTQLQSTPDGTLDVVQTVSELRATSAYTWLKLPALPSVEDMQRGLSATTLPTVLLGGDPGPDAALAERWAGAMSAPHVRGLVVGRSLLYPPDGDVAGAVDTAAAVLPRRVAV